MPPAISPEGTAVSPTGPHDRKEDSMSADAVAPPSQASPGLTTRPESLPPISSIAPPPAAAAPGGAPPITASSASPALPTQPRPPQLEDRQNGTHPGSPMMPQQHQHQPPGPLFGMLKTQPTLVNQNSHPAPLQPPPAPPAPPQKQQQQQHQLPTVTNPSPDKSYVELHDKWFLPQCEQLAHCLQGVSAPAVRRVVRDNWQKCLLGSDYHTAFVMNAAVHHASPGALQRGIRDFGETLVHATKVQIAGHLSTRLLDELAEIILSKASPRFLDKAVARRLPTIPAKTLLNSLARAERLGYDANDIEEDDEDDEPEPLAPPPPAVPQQPLHRPPSAPMPTHVQQPLQRPIQPQQPQQPAQLQQPAPPQTPVPVPKPVQRQAQAQGQASQSSQRVVPNGTKSAPQCEFCGRIFEAPSAHAWHLKKRVCRKPSPAGKGFYSRCPHCGQGFSSPMGLQYHLAHKVCGDFTGVAPATTHVPGPSPTTHTSVPTTTHASAPTLPRPPSLGNLVRTVEQPPSSSAPPPASSPLVQSDISAYRPPAAPPAAPVVNPPQTPTPSASQSLETDNYNSSASRAAAHLTPEQKLNFDTEMTMAEESLKIKIAEARKSWDPNDLERRLTSLKNSHATKQSQIRKKYGIRLRSRRGPTAMAAERDRVGLGATPIKNHHAPSTPSGPPAASRTPSSSQWTAANVPRPDSLKRSMETDASPQQPVKKLAVSQLTSGLAGSSATAATQDPTMMSSPSGARPQSSYGQPRPAGAQRISMGIAGRGVSREEPVEVDSSSDSGSDIPAE